MMKIKKGHFIFYTNNLERCEVLLPPDVFLIFRAHCRDHVVKVHNNMNERIQQSEEGTMATCY